MPVSNCRYLLLTAVIVGFCEFPGTVAAADMSPRLPAKIDFNRDIRPILSDKCFQCHEPGEADREEDLRMDIPDGKLGALTPREDYFIIKPGEPEESELWWRITEEYEDERMPPEKSHKEPL